MTTQIAPEPIRPDAEGRTRTQPKHEFVEYEQYIDQCVRRTQSTVRMVDFFSALTGLFVSLLAVALVASLLDHWIIPGGLHAVGRWFFLFLCLGVIGYFVKTRFWPMIFHRVNPEYAANTIEQHTPSLKNNLLNFLLFRRQPEKIHTAVLEGIEQQAALGLSDVEVETSVDRSHLIRLGYALVGLLIGGVLYTSFSPKNPLLTVARVVAPWSDVAVPSRVEILNVKPEERVIEIPRGDHLDVSAEVTKIGDEPVTLFYSTEDDQREDQPIEMFVPEGKIRYECKLPNDEVGVQQNMTFRIEAGDARTVDYQVRVTAAPTINIESVHYEYPLYTGYASRTTEDSGDLRAIEGTRVTIQARANQRIKSAYLDFDSDGKPDQALRIEDDADGDAPGTRATASFTLSLDEEGRAAKYDSYQLRFTNLAGHQNREPVRYTIDVLADQEPSIEIRQPRESEIELPEDKSLVIELEARDADFALAQVKLTGSKLSASENGNENKRNVSSQPDLERILLDEEHPGQFLGRFPFTPKEHGLRAGDLIEYWATAVDNKSPEPNVVETPKYRIRILPSESGDSPENEQEQPQDNQEKKDQEPSDQGANSEDQKPRQDPNQGGQDNQDQKQDGEKGESPDDAERQPNEDQKTDQDKGEEGKGSESEPKKGEKNEGEEGAEQQENTPQPEEAQSGKNGEQAKGEKGEQSGKPQQGEPSDDKSNAQGKNSAGQKENESSGEDSQSEMSEGGEGADSGADENSDPNSPQEPGAPDGQPKSQPNGEPGQNGASGENAESDASARPEPSESEEPVRNEGSDDAEAFERIKRHLEKQANEEARNNARQERASDPETTEASEARPEVKPNSDAASASEPMEQPQPQDEAGADKTAEKKQGESQDAKSGENSGEKQDSPQASSPQPSEGQEPTEDATQPPQGNQPKQDDEAPEGESGTTVPQDPKAGQTGDKQEKPAESKPPGEKDAASEAKDERESETEGQESGDRSGDGEEGKGQQSNREGTGAAGSNTDAEKGGETSGQAGGDRDSKRPGQDQQADHKTGKSSEDQKGPGTKSRESENSDSPSGDSASQEPMNQEGSRTEPQEKPGSAGGPADSQQSREGSPLENQGGGENWRDGKPPTSEEEKSVADKANLDYARKSTDMILEKLEDQIDQNQTDAELLNKLGWTEQDMKRFVERWQKLKDSTKGSAPENKQAQRELDERLRSLGLRNPGVELGQSDHQDKLKGLSETQRRPPPVSLQERLKKYLRGTNRAATKRDR